MNREKYIKYIVEKLTYIDKQVSNYNNVGLFDINKISENFFRDLCNIIFEWKLVNANTYNPNNPGFDLIDEQNQITIQVSSSHTKNKIENSLNKEIYKRYAKYRFIFIAITGESLDGLKKAIYTNSFDINFNPKEDIWNIKTLINKIVDLEIEPLEEVYNLVHKEFEMKREIIFESSLTRVVKILLKGLSFDKVAPPNYDDFNIEKKIQINNLNELKSFIKEYTQYHNKLDSIYRDFDNEGEHASFFVLSIVRDKYLKEKDKEQTTIDIFYAILNEIKQYIKENSQNNEITAEELDIAVNIIVVDAFIRCKIFEFPRGGYAII